MVRDVRIIVTSSVESVQYLTYGAFEFFVVLYAKSIGLDDFQIGFVSGMQLISVVLSKPLMGGLSDRAGRRLIIIGGLTLGGAALVLTSLAHDFSSLLAISIPYGVGFAAVTSSTPTYVSDLATKEDYGSAMGFLSTTMDVRQSLGPIVTAVVIEFLNYTRAFQLSGALLFIILVPLSLGTDKARK